jgi:hypothetical protein
MRRGINLLVIVLSLAVAWAVWKPLFGGQPFGPPRPATGPSAALSNQLTRPLPQMRFSGQALSDVLDFMRDVSGIEIRVEWTELKAAGVSQDAPISANLQSARLNDALTAILNSAGGDTAKLGFAGHSSTLLVTTKSRVDAGIVCNVYNVRDFFSDIYPFGQYTAAGSRVMPAPQAVAPETWKPNGGAGHIEEEGGWLVVYNTSAVQARVERDLGWRRWRRSAKAFAWRTAALLAGALLFANLTLTASRRIREGRRNRDLCEGCGYDLRASPERCPECGRLRRPTEEPSPPRTFISEPLDERVHL